MNFFTRGALAAILGTAAVLGTAVAASAAEVNVYSSRHYDTDKSLYQTFTQQTGIKVNIIEGRDDELIERIRTEAGNSPADILITVDAGRLWRAQNADILQPIKSKTLEDTVPAYLREPTGLWFGLTKRARVIIYNKAAVEAVGAFHLRGSGRSEVEGPPADPLLDQRLQPVARRLDPGGARREGDRGLGARHRRQSGPPAAGRRQRPDPGGGRRGRRHRDQQHLLFRPHRRIVQAGGQGVAEKVGVFFPNQNDRGTHVNISGAGVLKNAPNKENAVKFLEYLVSPPAQKIFAEGNYEYPVSKDAEMSPVIASWGSFKEDNLNAAVFGKNNEEALKIMDRAGWK